MVLMYEPRDDEKSGKVEGLEIQPLTNSVDNREGPSPIVPFISTLKERLPVILWIIR